jgi:hypothetical protein
MTQKRKLMLSLDYFALLKMNHESEFHVLNRSKELKVGGKHYQNQAQIPFQMGYLSWLCFNDMLIEILNCLNYFQIVVEPLETKQEEKEKVDNLKVVVTADPSTDVSKLFICSFGIKPLDVQSHQNGTFSVTLASQNDLETVLNFSSHLPKVR